MRIARREPKFSFKGRAGEGSNPLFRGFELPPMRTPRATISRSCMRLNTKDEFELRGGFPNSAEALFKYHAVILDRVEAGFFYLRADAPAAALRFGARRGLPHAWRRRDRSAREAMPERP